MITLTSLLGDQIHVAPGEIATVRKPYKREYGDNTKEAGAVIRAGGESFAVKETPSVIRTMVEAAVRDERFK